MTIPEKIHAEFLIIKVAFESGAIKKMNQLEKQKPTKIALLAGINQGRYAAKLYAPWEFTPSEIIRIALIIDIDPGLIINVIKNELLHDETRRILRNIEKVEVSKLKRTSKSGQ